MEIDSTPQPIDLSQFNALRPEINPVELTDSKNSSVKLYTRTNEFDEELVYQSLQIMEVVGNALITLSGIQALAQFAALSGRVKYLVHIDANGLQKMYWAIMIKAIRESETSDDAMLLILERLFEQIGNNKSYRDLSEYFLDEEDNVFKEPEQWEKIKSAVMENRIISICVDLRSDEAIDDFCTRFKRSGLTADTVYLTNLHQAKWLGKQRALNLAQKFQSLNPQRIIKTIFTTSVKCICSTRLRQGVALLNGPIVRYPEKTCPKTADHYLLCAEQTAETIIDWYQECRTLLCPFKDLIEPLNLLAFAALLSEVNEYDDDLAQSFSVLYDALYRTSVRRNLGRERIYMTRLFPEIMGEFGTTQTGYLSPLCYVAQTLFQEALEDDEE